MHTESKGTVAQTKTNKATQATMMMKGGERNLNGSWVLTAIFASAHLKTVNQRVNEGGC